MQRGGRSNGDGQCLSFGSVLKNRSWIISEEDMTTQTGELTELELAKRLLTGKDQAIRLRLAHQAFARRRHCPGAALGRHFHTPGRMVDSAVDSGYRTR
jgi:hypothetical protein